MAVGMVICFMYAVYVTAPLIAQVDTLAVFRPHCSTMYVDAAYSYRPSSMVCLLVGLSQ